MSKAESVAASMMAEIGCEWDDKLQSYAIERNGRWYGFTRTVVGGHEIWCGEDRLIKNFSWWYPPLDAVHAAALFAGWFFNDFHGEPQGRWVRTNFNPSTGGTILYRRRSYEGNEITETVRG